MIEDNLPKPRERRSITCFIKETWTLLGIALLCLSVDVYALLYLPHSQSTAPGESRIPPALPYAVVWVLEIALALLSLWLIRLAFSKAPHIKPAS